MDISCYVSIDGVAQGNIAGGCTHSDHLGKIELLSFDHDVSVPITVEYHHAGGKPVHQPVVVEKDIDQASPRLYQALFRGEKLNKVELEWYRFEDGKQQLYYRILLEGALISGIKPQSPHVLFSDQEKRCLSERVSFIYEKITWSWGQSGEVLYTQQWLDEV